MDPRQRYRALSAESLSGGDPTGWFERLYAEAETGHAAVPWDRMAPHPLLASWVADRGIDGTGRRALVVGSGTGDDAELISRLRFDTVAFDVSPAAVRAARRRFPSSNVAYQVADLFAPPASWHRAFDLVVEVFTVQSLPWPLHRPAIEHIGQFVAGGEGRLLVIAAARADDEPLTDTPPWPLTRDEIAPLEAHTRQQLDTPVE